MKFFDRVRALFPKPLDSDADQKLQEVCVGLRRSLEIVSAYGAVLARGSRHTTPSINKSEGDLPYSKQEIAQALVIIQAALEHHSLRTVLIQLLSPEEALKVLSPEYENSLGCCLVSLDTFVPAAEVEVEHKRWGEFLEKIDPSMRGQIEHTLTTAHRARLTHSVRPQFKLYAGAAHEHAKRSVGVRQTHAP